MKEFLRSLKTPFLICGAILFLILATISFVCYNEFLVIALALVSYLITFALVSVACLIILACLRIIKIRW